MTHTVRVVEETLSDGSKAYNVLVQVNGAIHAVTENDAYDLAQKMVDAITAHSVDAALVREGF